MTRRQLLVLQAELGGQPGPHVGEDHVGAAQQLVQNLARVRMLELEGQRVLAPIADHVVPALAGGQRRDVAAGLAFGRLDLDHVGAAVGEDLPGPGDGDEMAELEDGDAVERPRGAHPTT